MANVPRGDQRQDLLQRVVLLPIEVFRAEALEEKRGAQRRSACTSSCKAKLTIYWQEAAGSLQKVRPKLISQFDTQLSQDTNELDLLQTVASEGGLVRWCLDSVSYTHLTLPTILLV